MRTRVIAAAVCISGSIAGTTLNSHELLTLQITPLVAPAPGVISIRAAIDVSDENRGLEVTAQSGGFSQSSAIELDGRLAPRINVFQFAHLPAGEYDVSAVLLGTAGVRATTARRVLIMPAPGARR